MRKAIFKYKHVEGELEVEVLEMPKTIPSNKLKNEWKDLIIKFQNDKILEDKPFHFSLEYFDKDNIIYAKCFILDAYAYEKCEDNIKISFCDCIIRL